MRFAEGCLVRCIDAEGSDLVGGQIYEVEEIKGDDMVFVKEHPGVYYWDWRFERVSSGAPMEPRPYIIKNESIYGFDIDGTLVYRFGDHTKPGNGLVGIKNPYTGITQYLKPHVAHMELIAEMHARGRHILVWSASGVQWSIAVIKALGLERYVDTYMTKPIGYVDDLEANKWLNNHIFIPVKETAL